MADDRIQEAVDVLANPYLFGLPPEKSVPVSQRKQGEIFSQALISLRKMKYPATHRDSRGNGYVSARAFAAILAGKRPVYGTIVWAGKGYDVYFYDDGKMGFSLAQRGARLDAKEAPDAKENFLSAVRAIPKIGNAEILSVRVFISNSEFAPRIEQLLSDGDIEADSNG